MNAVRPNALTAILALGLACTSSQAKNTPPAQNANSRNADSMTAMKHHQAPTTPATEDARIELEKGQILTVAVSRHREGAEGKMQEYFEAVGPIAQPLGFSRLGALKVVEADAGSFEPNNFVGFYGFPSQDAAASFASDPRWPAIRATRPQIWSELRISHFRVETARELNFAPGRVYEVRYEFAPTSDTPSLKQKGARTILDLAEGSHEMTPSSLAAPIRIRVLEWANLAAAKAAPRPSANGRVDSLYTQL